MAHKRFTDTNKWTQNKWFRKLSNEHKLFWIYILDTCDSVGVWEEDIELASMLIGHKYSLDSLLKDFENRIHIFSNNKKWWIIDFCNFQYGELKEENITNKPHQSYISLLKKHSLWIVYEKTIHSLKDKDKDKDKDKEIDKEEKIITIPIKSNEDILIEKEKSFLQSLEIFKGQYTDSMLMEFFLYWTEKSTNGKLLRWEKEATWDLNRRLIRWVKNQKTPTFQNRDDKFAERDKKLEELNKKQGLL